jgi:hypothetical protein
MSTFVDKILDEREKPISDTTRKMYNRLLMKLNENKVVESFEILKNPKAILAKISHLARNTQKTYIIAICAILKNSEFVELYNTYFDILKNLNTELSVNTTKTKSQEENWIETEKIIAFRENMKKDVSTFDLMLNYLIVSLYTMIAPRRNIDFTLMKISNDMTDIKFNYLDIKNKKFIFNNYKTSGTYHTVEIDIPDELMVVINQYIKVHPFKQKMKNKKYDFFLIMNGERKSFSSDNMSKRLHKIFGKKVGCSLLRNIFLTDKYSGTVIGLENDVAAMGTSVGTAMNNYIKKS